MLFTHDHALGVVLSEQLLPDEVLCRLLLIPSFFLISNISICPDVDECSAFSSICGINATCLNSEGSYLCSCKEGFAGDGKACKGKANNLLVI